MAVGAVAAGAYVRGLDEHLADRFEGYRAHLQAQPLAAPTRRTYAGRVGGYLAWLAELDPVLRRQQGDPFTHGHARDYTVRDYRTHLIDTRKAKPASANLALAALDSFHRWLGLGLARVRRDELSQAVPSTDGGPDPPAAARRRTRRAARHRWRCTRPGDRHRAAVHRPAHRRTRRPEHQRRRHQRPQRPGHRAPRQGRGHHYGRSRSTPRPATPSTRGSPFAPSCPTATGSLCSCP